MIDAAEESFFAKSYALRQQIDQLPSGTRTHLSNNRPHRLNSCQLHAAIAVGPSRYHCTPWPAARLSSTSALLLRRGVHLRFDVADVGWRDLLANLFADRGSSFGRANVRMLA